MAAVPTIFESLVTGIPCPEGWRQTQVKVFAKIVGGSTPDRGDDRCWQGGQIPWVTPTDITAQKVKYLSVTADKITPAGLGSGGIGMLPAGTILYTSRATIGEKSIAAIPVTTNQGFSNFIPQGLESEFLFYLLDLLTKVFKRLGSGTTFPEVGKRDIKRVSCFIPPPKEQTRIAETLKAADDYIRALEEQLRKAERVAVALDQGHFSAGSHDVKFPYEYGTGRTIPNGWEYKPLGKIADVTSGITLNQDREAADNGIRYLTVINVHRGRIDLTEVRHLELRGNETETKRIAAGDVLVIEGHANSAEIGRAALATQHEAGMSFQNHLFRVRLFDQNEMRSRFLVRALNSARIRRHWVATANTSSGLNTINRTALRRLILPVPKPTEQDAIIERLEAAEEVVTSLKNQLTAARRVKQSLLQNLLTGKIRLRA